MSRDRDRTVPSEAALGARCWGTRGSLPSPGPDTVRFGGNTSCLEVLGPTGARLIFDAGTGIRPLGDELSRLGRPVDADLFLSHFHWDHIQGLPFFRPIYDSATTLRIHGARQNGTSVQSLIAGQMVPIYFPVPFAAAAARLEFFDVDEDQAFERGGLVVTAHAMRHPTRTFGYRVDADCGSLAYLPDNELIGGRYAEPNGWYESLRDFLAGTDVLFHDAMFTDAEYPQFEGWGHSSVSQAISLAEDAGVRRLCLFHHSPGRTDADLERIVDEARDDVARRGSAVQLEIATEGENLVIVGGGT